MDRDARSVVGRRRGRKNVPRPAAARAAGNRRTSGLGKGRVRALVRVGSRSDRGPAVAHTGLAVAEGTVCGGCGAVFARKTWRRSPRRLQAAVDRGAVRGLCPACRQVGNGRAFGRVMLEGSYVAGHADELVRRIRNVAARAAFTQPERRLVEIVMRGPGLEVLTTSQKLAHRVARELAKAFHGTVSYRWSDRDGRLLAVWRRGDEA